MFIVAALKNEFQAGSYKDCTVLEDGKDPVPPTHQEVFRAETRQESEAWAQAHEGKEVKKGQPAGEPPKPPVKVGNKGGGQGGGDENLQRDADPRWFWVSVGQNILLGIVVLALLGIFYQGLYSDYLNGDTADERARNLITYLVVFGTFFIAVLAILTAMFVTDKGRFVGAKDVLALMVGILGSIVGFYYGTTKKAEEPGPRTVQMKVTDPTFNPNPLNRDKDATVSFDISGGTPPYKYKILVPEANANIEDNSNSAGEVKQKFNVNAATNVSAANYSIEVTDAANKSVNRKNTNKVPIQ
jgi:hypothetical protein